MNGEETEHESRGNWLMRVVDNSILILLDSDLVLVLVMVLLLMREVYSYQYDWVAA